MENKLNYIVERIGSIDKTLEFQSQQLADHIQRTHLLEERLTPIEDHVKFIRTLMKLSTYIITVGGFILMILSYVKK